MRATTVITDRRYAGLIACSGILLIAMLDFVTGVELRVYPFYFAPVGLAAWVYGTHGSIWAAGLSAVAWFTANQLGGQEYSHPVIWVANTGVQGAAFAFIGYLIAHLRQTLRREQALARTDPLSGLLNHRAFYEESARILALCRRGRRPVTLAYLDLDDFKLVNDTHGHLAGDELLRAIGQVLQSTKRSSDLAARVGGDEFAILLPELSPADAGQALHRLRDAIAQSLGGASPEISVSIGAITAMAAPTEVETLIHKADSVLYQAKSAGKNRIRLEVEPEIVALSR